jgi:hypothetical protein
MGRRREVERAVITVTCLKCGEDCEVPEKEQRLRVLSNPATDRAEVFVDVTTPCEHCGAKRVRILVSFTMSDAEA